MALSATFTANFSSFYDAVEKADAKLKDFGAGADKVGGRLTALGNSFSGVKIVQDATLMVKAVEDIGGASKLTEKELARLGATTNEAVAKMKALGMDIPKNLQDIADQTKGANKATTDWMGTLTKIAGAMGIAFSVGMIKDFIGSVFDAAGAVKDLSEQWGVSTKFVQQWGAAAAQSGVESEQLGKTIQYMTEKLSESSPEYAAMIKNIGLSTEALRKMSAEDAYKEIIQKIAGIKDETLQLDVAMGVLGPSAKKIIGGIRDGMYEAADAQKYMSDETIKRLEAAGDAWARLKNKVIIYSGEMLAAAEHDAGQVTSSWGKFFTFMTLPFTAPVALTAMAAGVGKTDAAVSSAAASFDDLAKSMPPVAAQGAALTTGIKTQAEVLAELKAKTDATKKAEADRAAALAKAKADEEAYTKAVKAHLEAVDDLARTLSGDDLIGKANLYLDALKRSLPIEQMTAEQQANINKVMLDAIEVYHAAGTVAPDAMYDTWRATQVLDTSLVDTTVHVQLLGDMLKGLPAVDLSKYGTAITLKKPIDAAAEFRKSIEDLSGAFAQLGQISGGAFGEVATEIGIVVGAMNLAQKSTDTWVKGLAQLKAGNLKQGLATTATGAIGVAAAFQSATEGTGKLQSTLNGAAIGFSVGGPWGAAVGAGVGLLKGFINAHNAANKAAEDTKNSRQAFIAAAGGLHELSKEAEAAGANLDALMHARSADQVQAAIKGIQDAITFQADAMQLAIDTAEKYGFTLEELGPAMQRQQLDKQAQELYQDWQVLNTAGIDTIAITHRMSEAVSKYVQDAVAMGQEVPAAMKPMIDAMIKNGDLVDANGEAFGSAEDAGITFAMTMSDGFKALIEQVTKLTDAITRGLGGAIENVPDVQVGVVYDPDAGFRSHFHPVGSYASGTDGFKNFGAGTPVMLHGWEAVVPREDAGAFATVAAPSAAPAVGGAPTVIVNAQGAFFDTPESLQRLANKVGDALTAKYSISGRLRAAV